MIGTSAGWKRRAKRLLSEPMFHFLVAGGLLFLAHRWVAGDPRVVVVTPGVRAELARAFQDGSGRAPTPDELQQEVRTWRQDEALSREARREGLDRNDRTIRAVLADHLRARVAQDVPRRQPNQEDLDAWLAAHRATYEAPRRIDYQTLVFPRSDPAAAAELSRVQRALAGGADPRGLGRPLVGGELTDPELVQRLGAPAAARLQGLPVGKWERVETDADLLLARVNAVSGGLPPPDELRPRLYADWQYAQREREIEQRVAAIIGRYAFQERW